jgi:predicted nucleotidyltransferase
VTSRFRTRDFVRTPEQLYFAVVSDQQIEGRVFCFLRYAREGTRFQKLSTSVADELLASRFPQYRLHSQQFCSPVHAVPIDSIQQHFQPRLHVARLLDSASRDDHVATTACQAINWLARHGIQTSEIGITGSLLIQAHHAASDIDLVLYDRRSYIRARELIQRVGKENGLSPLSDELWKDAYDRRGCSLSFEDFLWHERRKYNKFSMHGRKIDISLCVEDTPSLPCSVTKLRTVDVTARVLRDDYSFDHPAIWQIDCPVAKWLVSWTPTFTGQAFRGEIIRIRGWLEESDDGQRQIVVGSSRESPGEMISVVRRSSVGVF